MTTASFSAVPVVALVRRFFNIFAFTAASGQCLPQESTTRFTTPWSLSQWSKRQISNSTTELHSVEVAQTLPPPGPEEPQQPQREPPKRRDLKELYAHKDDLIHQLLLNPALYNPLHPPRFPIVLSHGLYGFDVRGPSSFPKLQMHYWSNVLHILRKTVGAEVIVTSVPGTGSVTSRAEELDRALKDKAYGRAVNFMAHSMGGLDCRHLITHLKPTEYTPISLTTISTPHRGSPFMDWCNQYIGIGKLPKVELTQESADSGVTATLTPTSSSADPIEQQKADAAMASLTASLAGLPSTLSAFLLSTLDSPAYGNLSTAYLNNVFNPRTPDDPRVRYFSVSGRSPTANIWHPLWLPKMVLDAWEAKERTRLREADGAAPAPTSPASAFPTGGAIRGPTPDGPPLWARDDEWGNDGLVTIQSAKWGTYLGTVEGCDHWEIRGARGIELDIDLSAWSSVSISMPGVSLRDWDWGSFLGAWRSGGDARKADAMRVDVDAKTGTIEAGARVEEHEAEKSSMEKLGVVFDWISEHVPTEAVTKLTSRVSDVVGSHSTPEELEAAARGTNRKGERNELATKEDLERFYVALSRNLYNEGL